MWNEVLRPVLGWSWRSPEHRLNHFVKNLKMTPYLPRAAGLSSIVAYGHAKGLEGAREFLSPPQKIVSEKMGG